MKNKKKKTNISLNRVDSEYAVEIEGLEIVYKTDAATVHAVNSIDLKLKKKSVLGLVGETGAGKTTAMLSLLKLIQSPPGIIQSGKIRVNGLDIMSLSPEELCAVRGSEISMIFQDPMTSLNPVMTVGEQIAESVLLHDGVSREEAMKRAKDMLQIVGIDPERSGEYPHQFSGGMRQRVGIAIALACKPTVLIADEPTTALDVTIQAQVLRLMKELQATYGTSMILITHDLGVVAEMCDRVAVMYAGRIVEEGTAEDIFNATMHPYTEGLFNSLPNIQARHQKLQPISGLMPDPSNLPSGCAFADRCPYAVESCHAVLPKQRMITDTHMVACSAYDDPEFQIKRRRTLCQK